MYNWNHGVGGCNTLDTWYFKLALDWQKGVPMTSSISDGLVLDEAYCIKLCLLSHFTVAFEIKSIDSCHNLIFFSDQCFRDLNFVIV